MKNCKIKLLMTFVVLAAILCASVLLLAACHDKTPPTPDPPTQGDAHVHNYKETVYPATCTEPGSRVYECGCGDSYSEIIPSRGHDLQWTFAEGGAEHWQACSRCDYETAHERHDFAQVVQVHKQPTCTEEGLQTVQCKCGSVRPQTISKSAHSYTVGNFDNVSHWTECSYCHTEQPDSRETHVYDIVVESTPSTCTEAGSVVTKCNCGALHTEQSALADHNYQLQTDEAEHWLQCVQCQSVEEGSRAAHSYDELIEETASTCVERGKRVTACSCGRQHTELSELASHNYANYLYSEAEHWRICVTCQAEDPSSRAAHTMVRQSLRQPTCTDDGVEIKLCVCGKEEEVILDAVGHSYDYDNVYDTGNETGHLFKCVRCDSTERREHTFVPCDCPNGYAEPATCGKDGHSDEKCTVCDYLKETRIPATGQHTPSSNYDSNGTHHWKECTVCGEELDKAQHSDWQTVVTKQPTCTEAGREAEQCAVCKYKRSSGSVGATGHKFDYVEESRKAPTCTQDGSIDKVCSVCGFKETELIKTDGHQWGTEWFSDEGGHWHKCTVCFTEQSNHGSHDFRQTEYRDATCTTDGCKIERCSACDYERETVVKAHHAWVSSDDGRKDATCTEYGSHTEYCDKCGETRTVIDEQLGYADHDVEYFDEKPCTDSERGWIRYWKCKVCGRYFSTKDCHEELDESQVYIYPTKVIKVDSIGELVSIAMENFSEEASTDYYQITAQVISAYGEVLQLRDGQSYYVVDVQLAEANYSILAGDTVTVKGFLYAEIEEGSSPQVGLCEAVIVSVEQTDDEIVSLFVKVSVSAGKPTLYATSETGEFFGLVNYGTVGVTDYYNQLMIGEKLTFYFSDYGDKNGVKSVVSRLVINGKSYTMTGGILEITVEETINAEFEFSQYRSNVVVITEIATDTDGDAISVDPYITYRHVNGRNAYADNRLYANSYLRFTVVNAYITRVEIEFADYNIDEVRERNIFRLGVNAYNLAAYTFDWSGTTAKKEFSGSLGLTYFEYYAAAQARVKSVKIHYETYNT